MRMELIKYLQAIIDILKEKWSYGDYESLCKSIDRGRFTIQVIDDTDEDDDNYGETLTTWHSCRSAPSKGDMILIRDRRGEYIDEEKVTGCTVKSVTYDVLVQSFGQYDQVERVYLHVEVD